MIQPVKIPAFKSLKDIVTHDGLSLAAPPAALNVLDAVALSAPAVAGDTAAFRAPVTGYTVADSLVFASEPSATAAPATAATTAPDNHQPYLAIRQFVPISGVYPPRPAILDPDAAPNDSNAYLGAIRMFAGTFTPGGTLAANGQLLSISQNTALFSLYGTTYGGNGYNNFALPDLGGNASVSRGQGNGLSPRDLGETYGSDTVGITQSVLTSSSGGFQSPIENTQPTLTLNWMISAYGIYPSQNGLTDSSMQLIGLLAQFGGNFTPVGYLACDGSLLQISEYDVLFSLIGTTFGGDGETTFALPDLRGRTIVGADAFNPVGAMSGANYTTISQHQMPTSMGGGGQPISNQQPSLALNYMIALQGIFPSQDGGGADSDESYIGEIVVSALNFAPKGWAICAGQLLPINQNQALFSLLGTTYGGNGITNFALPDFRGRTAVGVDDAYVSGQTGGSASFLLNASDIPALSVNGDSNNNSLYGGDDNDSISGGDGNDTLVGNGGNDRLDGGTGADSLTGGTGNDTYIVDDAGDIVVEASGQGTDVVEASATHILSADVETLMLTGASDIDGTGNALNNVLSGNSGTNVLSGGVGDDTYYVQNTTDNVVEANGQGNDIIFASVSYNLAGRYVETLTLTGTGNIDAVGNGTANFLIGNVGNNRLDGGGNNDTMTGGGGDDTYVVSAVGDIVIETVDAGSDTVESAVTYMLGAYVENLTLTGSANINGTGNGLNNVLTGNLGNNTLKGGAGDDTYYVDSASDLVVEVGGEGIDIIYSSDNRGLFGTFVENLTLTGSANVVATGNSLNNRLVGNSGNNVMTGLAGHDTYVVQNAGDTVNENANEGNDVVESSVTFTLSANVETLTLTGAAAINGTGNGLNNVLTGNAGNNVLGGGAGDDTYYVQNTGDSVVEASNAGTDLIISSVTYSLSGRQAENLTLTGLAALNATGNGGGNILTGNDGGNVLDGGGGHDRLNGGLGADTMIGGTGNDTYVVENAGDVVTEASGGGTDVVESTISYALGTNVEQLVLTGSTAIDGTGNDLSNVLTGNSGINVLTGGLGNDTYYVQNTADDVVEAGGQGTDLIYSSVTYSLTGRYAETIVLTGTANIAATGNSQANTLIGNDGNNKLNGKGGTDILTGGLGADIFLFEAASGVDTISDFSAAQNDTININAYTGGTANSSLVTQSGSDVVITLGGGNVITVQNALQADVVSHIVW